MQYVLDIVEFKRVTGIGSSLETGNNIIIGTQGIHNLPLSFITPLKAK
jgi:hypothetical protein